VASKAPTKQATAHRPTKVDTVPKAAKTLVDIWVSVVSCATDLVWFLLFANDACLMIRLPRRMNIPGCYGSFIL
jgi:hypothetical protein